MSNIKMVRLTSGEEIICKYNKGEECHILKDSAILFSVGQGSR